MLCYVMLCYVMLCYVMLCYVASNCPTAVSTKVVHPALSRLICPRSLYRSATFSCRTNERSVTQFIQSRFEFVLLLCVEPHQVGRNFTKEPASSATALVVLSYLLIHCTWYT